MQVFNEDHYVVGEVEYSAGTYTCDRQRVGSRYALLVIASTMSDLHAAFGKRGRVDPIRHLLGTAWGWGGNLEKDAIYLTITPARNDGNTVHKITLQDVPVDGFWSVSVYGADGNFSGATIR